MTRRASWLELDHAASLGEPSNTALLGDEERGRISNGMLLPPWRLAWKCPDMAS